MIHTLPLEIILNISRNLNFEDKLSLKTTCHKLNGFLTKALLYEELNLLNSRYMTCSKHSRAETCNEFLQKLIKEQFDGSFVKILHIELRVVRESLLPRLPDLFPNVTRIIVSTKDKDRSAEDDGFLPNDSRIKHLLLKWKDTIERVDSRFDWEVPIKELLNNTFPRLTELDITHFNRHRRSWQGVPSKVLPTNVPLLTRLTLRETGISLELLEEIHTDFPLLKSLRLIDCKICSLENAVLPPTIVPACTILYLEFIDLYGFADRYDILIDYILKKYTNLQQLVYSIEPRADYAKVTSGQFNSLIVMSREEFEEFISTETDSSEATSSTNSALETKLFSNLPTSIKTLTLYINNIENAVAALAETNLKLITLDLIDYKRFADNIWWDPSMLKHFKKLTSLKTLKIPFHSSLQTFNSDYISLSVTKLVVDICGYDFCIDWVFSMFPSIEELYINQSVTFVDYHADLSKSGAKNETQMRTLYPKLRLLKIAHSYIYPEALEFFKAVAPNLAELDMEWPIPRSASRVVHKIDLSNWYLNKCYLSFTSMHYVDMIHCTIIIQNISKHFVIDNTTKMLVPTCQTFNDDKIGEYVEILMSDCINHIRLFGFHIVKIGDKIVIDY